MNGISPMILRQLLGPTAAPMDQLIRAEQMPPMDQFAAGVISPRADQRSPNRFLGVPDFKLPGMEGWEQEARRRVFFGTLDPIGSKPRLKPIPPQQNVTLPFTA